jgi:protoheme IX farnesyltransferase
MVGFVAAALAPAASTPGGFWSLGRLWAALACLAGTAMAAAGANAINQWMERDRDAVMVRTSRRPLPTARVSPRAVLTLGVGLSALGVLVLLLLGVVPALVSLACVLSYVLVYTPLKPRTTLATFVGAIPGGLPPLIGWSAAFEGGGWASLREPLGLSLAAIMLVWQIPHFLAIAWMYREDYERGGYRVLPSLDPDGRWTSMTIALWALALLPTSLLPALLWPTRLGGAYAAVATATGLAYALLTAWLLVTRARREARRVFFASIMHLPLLLFTLVGELVVRAALA